MPCSLEQSGACLHQRSHGSQKCLQCDCISQLWVPLATDCLADTAGASLAPMWSRPWPAGTGPPSGDTLAEAPLPLRYNSPRVSTVLVQLAIFYPTSRWKQLRFRPTQHCFARNSQMWVLTWLRRLPISRLPSVAPSLWTTLLARERRHVDGELALESCTSRGFLALVYLRSPGVQSAEVLVGAGSAPGLVRRRKCLDVFRLLQSGIACFGGRGGVIGNSNRNPTRYQADRRSAWHNWHVPLCPHSFSLRSATLGIQNSRVFCAHVPKPCQRVREKGMSRPHTLLAVLVTLRALPVRFSEEKLTLGWWAGLGLHQTSGAVRTRGVQTCAKCQSLESWITRASDRKADNDRSEGNVAINSKLKEYHCHGNGYR